MKKCPGCGSIDSDEADRCGVCGASLLEVQSINESLEQAELESDVKEKAGDQRLDREQRRRLHRGAITGLLVGLSLTLLGGWLLILGIVGGDILPFVVGFFVLVFGVVSVESVLGLFECAPYHGQAWTGWIAMRADREEKEREKEVESD